MTPMDEKIKRMQEKISNLNAIVAVKKEEAANTKDDVSKANESSYKHSSFGISEANKKLMALNVALTCKQREVEKQNGLLLDLH